jgi:23S rRNA (uracil1939-C5)-methyltransferase
MPRKNKVQNFSQLQVVDISAKGAGVAKTAQGQVLFVPGAIPGDLINATAFKKRKGVLEGRLNTIEQPSPHRIDPKCDYFGTCGGCKWQNMSYPAQLEFKQNIVSQNLYKIGHIIPQETLPIKGADEVYFYRNKMEFSFSNQRWLEQSEIAASETILTKNGLGFHKPGMWDKVVDIQQCHLQGDPSNAIRNWIKAFAESKGLAFFDPRNQSGFLRTLMIRNTRIGEIMVLIQFFHEDQENRIALLTALKAAFPQITSLLYCTNPKGNDSLYDQNIECLMVAIIS